MPLIMTVRQREVPMRTVNLRQQIASRLRSERQRLGFSRRAFAYLSGISNEGLRQCEQGLRGFRAEWLARAMCLGCDGQYVLTGVRSINLSDISAGCEE